jgi:hypothetical protein
MQSFAQEIVVTSPMGTSGKNSTTLQFSLRWPISLRERGENRMHVAMAVAFSMILVAPFFGRWRANVWLKANMPQERASVHVAETA